MRSISLTLLLASALPVLSQTPQAGPAPKVAGSFDPAADPAKDLKAAEAEAQKANKRILVDVGGNWCSWCRLMDKWFDEHADVRALRDKNYVLLKVNYSEENKNEAFLGQFPKVNGYPYFFVLDKNGKLLQPQGTGELEDGKGYSVPKMTTFLQTWSGK